MEKKEVKAPQLSKELEKADKEFKHFQDSVQNLNLDKAAEAPKLEQEQQTRLSSREIAASKDVYLKPKRTFNSKEKFNERFRDDYNHAKEYVQFIAENREISGETITLWTKCFPGQDAEEWDVPVNKPVWGPRYLAERIKNCTYHRLVMEDGVRESGAYGSVFGTMVAKNTINRLDAIPVNSRKSIFLGASSF